MPTIKVLVGSPGSGKTTYAKSLEEKGYIRVSQDDQGKEGHKITFQTALDVGRNVVIDRMNFNKEQRARYITPALDAGYDAEIVTFYIDSDTCMDRVLMRGDHPTIKAPEDARRAMNMFFRLFEPPTPAEGALLSSVTPVGPKYAHLLGKGYILVDLDGSLCNIDHRLHYVQGEGKKNWKAFFEWISDDVPNKWCMELITSMKASGYEIVFASGRGEEWRSQTVSWLEKHVPFEAWDLYMRPRGDFRGDDLVKEVILSFQLLPSYGKPLFVVDDRKRVADMWRRWGLTVLHCAEGEF